MYVYDLWVYVYGCLWDGWSNLNFKQTFVKISIVKQISFKKNRLAFNAFVSCNAITKDAEDRYGNLVWHVWNPNSRDNILNLKNLQNLLVSPVYFESKESTKFIEI